MIKAGTTIASIHKERKGVELVGTKALHLDLQWVQKKVEQH